MLRQNFASYWKPSENRLRAGDVNEILAWVDYCIVKRLGPNSFEKSIVAHLSHTCHKDFTFKQINVKIKELWKTPVNSSRPNGEALSDHTIVYRVGTKALRGNDFNDERAQSVKARVQQLMKQPVPEYAKPSSQRSRKKRKIVDISASDAVATRVLKKGKRSHLSPRAHNISRMSPRDSISVLVRHGSFVNMRVARETNPGASRSLQHQVERRKVLRHGKIVELNLLSLNVSRSQA
jgi:hypothetical protein